jgi:hypothetical protein
MATLLCVQACLKERRALPMLLRIMQRPFLAHGNNPPRSLDPDAFIQLDAIPGSRLCTSVCTCAALAAMCTELMQHDGYVQQGCCRANGCSRGAADCVTAALCNALQKSHAFPWLVGSTEHPDPALCTQAESQAFRRKCLDGYHTCFKWTTFASSKIKVAPQDFMPADGAFMHADKLIGE